MFQNTYINKIYKLTHFQFWNPPCEEHLLQQVGSSKMKCKGEECEWLWFFCVSTTLAVFSLGIIYSVPTPPHPHASAYYRNTEIVHVGLQKSNEHHVTVNSRYLKASMFTFKLGNKLEKEKECHRLWRACYTPLQSEKCICWKQAATTHEKLSELWVQLERKISVVIHCLVRGIHVPDTVHNILRVFLNHFLEKLHSPNSPKLCS